MRPYEIAVIFDASLEESVIRDITDRIADLVRSRGGMPGHIERWGRRTFAYELAHRNEGYYVFIEVVAEPAVVDEVSRLLALSDEVLRHRVIRQPEAATGAKRKTLAAVTPSQEAAAAG